MLAVVMAKRKQHPGTAGAGRSRAKPETDYDGAWKEALDRFFEPCVAFTVKMADSGIFGKNGCDLTYEELFRAYRLMRTEYGIIIDVFGDCEATIRSAAKALEAYDEDKDHFNLVAVAQGETVDEYLRCYEKLKERGTLTSPWAAC
jgi:hypothetical protein